MNLRCRRNLSAVLLYALAACATAPVKMGSVDFAPVQEVEVRDFPGIETIVQRYGVQPEDERARFDAGLFAVEVHRDGDVDRRLLWIEAPDPRKRIQLDGSDEWVYYTRTHSAQVTVTPSGGEPDTREYKLTVRPVNVRHCMNDGELVCESSMTMSDEGMQSGFWGYVAPDATRAQSDLGTLFINRLQHLVDDDDTLQDLLFLVVDKPSVLSVITNLGLRVSLRYDIPETDPIAWPDEAWVRSIGAGELRPMQLQVDVNGKTALQGDLLISEPVGGLTVGGGLCAAVLRNPSDEGRFAVVKLLAVRRRGT